MSNSRRWTRAAARIDEMSAGKRALVVGIDGDGDIHVSICVDGLPIEDAERNVAKVEFCTTSAGGGRSPETRRALHALYVALLRDAKKNPEGIPPFPLFLKEDMEEGIAELRGRRSRKK